MLSNSDIAKLISQQARTGGPLANLTRQQISAIQNSLEKYCAQLDLRAKSEILNQAKTALLSILNPQQQVREGEAQTTEVGYNPASAQTALADIAEKLGATDLAESGFIQRMISIATDVARGAGRFVAQNSDPDEVDAVPALALTRVYDRDVPRGFKRGPKGTWVPVPSDDWPSRWAAAGDEAGDDDWLPWDGDSQDGRGVALKSSGIWQALGDGAGGYDDTLGNPFPPFAFNSGFDVDGVDRAEAESLGLLDKGEKAEPSPMNLTQLFADIAKAD